MRSMQRPVLIAEHARQVVPWELSQLNDTDVKKKPDRGLLFCAFLRDVFLSYLQSENEFTSYSFRGDHIDVLIMGKDYLLCDGKSEPGALLVLAS